MDDDDYYEDYYDDYIYNDSYYNFDDWVHYSYPADIASQQLNTYLPPFLLVIGTIGNILSAIIITKVSFHVLTLGFYLVFQAIADAFVLYIRCGNTWIKQILNVDITLTILNQSNTSCQVYSFISNFLLHLCAWVLVAALVEAALVTLQPLNAHRICSLDRTKNVLLLILLILVCANAHFFWTYGLEEDYINANVYFCTFTTFGNHHHHSEHFRGIVWPIMDLVFASVLPGLIIMGCCVVILVVRFKQNPPRSLLENMYLLEPLMSYDLVTVTLVLGLLSLILTLPEVGYNIFALVFEKVQPVISDPEFFAKRNLGLAVCLTFRDIFLSCKVFVFLFWPGFRQELSRICCRVKRRKRISTNTNLVNSDNSSSRLVENLGEDQQFNSFSSDNGNKS